MREAHAKLAAGDAGALVESKLDRLTRSVHDFSGLLTNAAREDGGVIMLGLGCDTTTAAGKLVANAVAAVAERKHDMIALRPREGLAAALAKGIRLAGPPECRQGPLRASFATAATV